MHHGDTEDAEGGNWFWFLGYGDLATLEAGLVGSLVCEELTRSIIGAAIEVHRILGPGLLESAYEECLCHELSVRGHRFQRQVPLPVAYKSIKLDCGYRMDLVVEDTVVLELKSVAEVLPVHEAQLITYLKLSRKEIGLLINFNVPVLKDGILRRVN